LLVSRREVRRAWFLHVVAVGALIAVLRVAGVPVWIYMLGFVFGGSSLTALRSFVEHRAVDGPRSAIVRSGWFFSMIFLNNNLHYTHHQLPGAAWFHLPKLTNDLDADAVAADGAGAYRGYRDVARRFMFKPFDQPVHPLSVTIDG
jgi:fatty acid desaturase